MPLRLFGGHGKLKEEPLCSPAGLPRLQGRKWDRCQIRNSRGTGKSLPRSSVGREASDAQQGQEHAGSNSSSFFLEAA